MAWRTRCSVRWHKLLNVENRDFTEWGIWKCAFLWSAFRGAYCGSGGSVQAGALVSQLRRKMSGFPGWHVQRWNWGSEAAVNPCAEGNLYPYNTERGPAGHGLGCIGGGITNYTSHSFFVWCSFSLISDDTVVDLQDSSRDIREALHELICYTNVSTKECIQLALLELLKNLNKYPTDRNSIWK